MPRKQTPGKRLATATRWPGGVALTMWRYLWQTVPVHRWDLLGSAEHDRPPPLPDGVSAAEVQTTEDGVGPLLHRLYRTQIRGSLMDSAELMQTLTEDLDRMAPSTFASFQKLVGEPGRLQVGDEYVVRMPGPWDGPVRVVAVTPTAFRLVTLDGHLEAGQIEFRVHPVDNRLEVVIESWARSGSRLSNLLYTHVGISKEVQLLMWTSVLQRITRIAGGRLHGGIVVTTRHVHSPGHQVDGSGPSDERTERRLSGLEQRSVNFDTTVPVEERTPENGWRRDDMRQALPGEAPGPPADGGSWKVARELMSAYQVADPGTVRASYRPNVPLAGRTMLLQIHFLVLRFPVGVRVGDVYDETRTVNGETAYVFGWDYKTLEGHFEQGQMHYEVWKWDRSGAVEFRLHAYSRAARNGPLILRLGFRLIGRRQQLAFYREACRRMRRITESELETERIERRRP
ncbi:hypothetical protein DSM112329_01146 [Paraconexibacter sp. AEG42_29]|uniref:DUF1990 domain-containing protein n=1 Tax=Paraconexibacter sp. AEG42_29 TaxID=2997339 RepID=A0AAU7ASG2_9ACTN